MRIAELGSILLTLVAAGCGFDLADARGPSVTGGAGGSGATGGAGGDATGGGGAQAEGGSGGTAAIELHATIDTNKGPIVVELNSAASPITVENFRSYADAQFYDGLIFHRVIKDFMVQGGGLLPDMTEKTPLFPPIVNEAQSSGLSNLTGTIAMARTSVPNSATSQFYINTADNTFLDPGQDTTAGYCVFGMVIEGMPVVTTIENVATQSVGAYDDVPVDPVLINSIVVEQM